MAAGDGTTTTTTANGAPAAPPANDNAALRAARSQLSERTRELEALRGEVEQLRARADTADTLNGEVKRLKAEITGLGEAHRTERALWSAGVTDPDEVELLKFAHSRIAEKDRPPLDTWVAGLKADPTKAPKLLAPIAARWGSDSKSSTTTATTPRPRVNPNKTTVREPEVESSAPTPEEWADARRRAIAGDRKLYDELKKRAGLPTRSPRGRR